MRKIKIRFLLLLVCIMIYQQDISIDWSSNFKIAEKSIEVTAYRDLSKLYNFNYYEALANKEKCATVYADMFIKIDLITSFKLHYTLIKVSLQAMPIKVINENFYHNTTTEFLKMTIYSLPNFDLKLYRSKPETFKKSVFKALPDI